MQATSKIGIAAAVLLTIVILTRGQNTTNDKTTTQGRYLMISASVQGFGPNAVPTVEQRVFMLDTTTGKVWDYVPSGPFTTPAGKPGFTPAMLVRVFVDELEGTVPDQMQKAVDYFNAHPARVVTPKH